MKNWKLVAIGVMVLTLFRVADAGPTFDKVRTRGFVQCGVSTGVSGFSAPDSKGEWHGLDVDMCRAIAAAMFGETAPYKVTPLNTQQRFTALQGGEIDVLTRNTTQSISRDTTLGLEGTGVNYYDSQGVMVRRDDGVKSATALQGATVCVQPGTTTELNLVDWFQALHLNLTPVVIENYDEIVKAFAAGRCDAFTTDKSQLAATRMAMLGDTDGTKYVILPEDLSKEPLGPMVRQDDMQWFNVVRWTLNAMLEAEEYNITSKNVDEMLKSSDPNVKRILGDTPGIAKKLGLNERWVYFIIKQVGNYGESFDRNIGKPLRLARGLNAQWKEGGLMYGWPLR